MYKGRTFIISGPSGVGKSTVLKELFKDRDDLYFSVSATTRSPRPGEVDGVHYHFTNVDEFRKMISEDAFLEYAEYVGNFYGTPKKYVDEAMEQGKDVVLDIEVQGALQVIGKRPDTVRIFIAPPSWDALEQRLLSQNAQHKDWTCSEEMMKLRHRQPGKGAKAPRARKGRAPDRQHLRLFRHQRHGGTRRARDQRHHARRALQARRAHGYFV